MNEFVPVLTFFFLFLAGSRTSCAQTSASSISAPPKSGVGLQAGNTPHLADYLLGTSDQITVSVADLESDFADKMFRVGLSGELTLPYVGRLHVAGLTLADLEIQIRERLRPILKDPMVVVILASYGSQPVSILGSVYNPGVRQIEGRKSLFEVLSLAGGLRPDAGYLIRISRDVNWGPIPLPGAELDPSGRVTTASIKIKDIMNATNVANNILILPGDTISIPKADVVYAIGSLIKPGGFLLNEHESLSALQVVSLAEGLQRTAGSNRAKILRKVDGGSTRTEIPVNLKLLMAGKGSDVQLQADDILFVPNSNAKSAGYRTLEAIAGAAGSAFIYAR